MTDQEVDEVCKHLRSQGEPDYLDLITDDPDGALLRLEPVGP